MPVTLKPLAARDPNESHRAATQLELFFDLVSVIAIAAATAALHHQISEGHGLITLARFFFIFFAIWWPWMNFTWFASAFDNDDALYRLTTIVIMGGYLMFASGAEHILLTGEFGIGLAGWIIIRLGMVLHWLRAAMAGPEHRRTALRYAGGIFLAQALWTILYFAVPPSAPLFYIGAVAISLFELAVPGFAEKAGVTPWHRHHIIERYGLLNIIVLGEALLALSLMFGNVIEGHQFDWAYVSEGWIGLIIVFVIWWIYFLEENHLSSDKLGRALLWGYGHYFLFLAGAVIGAGLGAVMDVTSHHSHLSAGAAAAWVNGAVALYLFTLWVIRDRFAGLGWRGFVLPAATLVFIAAGLVQLPLIWTAGLAILTLLARLELGEKE